MLNKEQLIEAREWLKELTFADIEEDELDAHIDGLTDSQVEAAIKRHYGGGISEFINCN